MHQNFIDSIIFEQAVWKKDSKFDGNLKLWLSTSFKMQNQFYPHFNANQIVTVTISK